LYAKGVSMKKSRFDKSSRGSTGKPPARGGRELTRRGNDADSQSASFLAAIIENSDDAIVSKDLNGIITSWNRGAERLFGYKAEEVIGKPVSILIPADHIDEEPKILGLIRRGERVEHYETVRRRKDGSLVDIALSVSPIKDADGRITGASKIARDITERRRAEGRLRQSEERYRVTLSSIGDAVISCDKEGRVTFANSIAVKLTGWSPHQALGEPLEKVFQIVNEFTRQPVENPVARVIREGAVVGLANHTILISKDGTEWPIDDSAAPIRDPNGDLAGVVLVFRDATKQRTAERALRQLAQEQKQHAQKLEADVAERTANLQQTIADLEAFSFTISHDLRSPLRAMQGFAQAALTEYADKLDAQGRDYLERICNSAVRLDRLILEVLTYSRLGRGELALSPINLDKLVEEVFDSYPSIRSSQAEVTVEHPLHSVLGSHSFLIQCISNLLENAVKFVPWGSKAKVRIWTSECGSKTRLYVEDNGIGIPLDSLSKIFEPFQRAHPGGGYEGTGMGLAIVRKAMQRLGGTAGVQPHDGQGSTFWLELPTAK
jgi:PAS domain S-box-containing protein